MASLQTLITTCAADKSAQQAAGYIGSEGRTVPVNTREAEDVALQLLA